MTDDEQKARAELAKHGDLIDPRYTADPAKAERRLQEIVRQCWKYRANFPKWIRDYIDAWKANAAPKERGSAPQRPSPEVVGVEAVPAISQERAGV